MKRDAMKHPMGTILLDTDGTPQQVMVGFRPSASRRPALKCQFVAVGTTDGGKIVPVGKISGEFRMEQN